MHCDDAGPLVLRRLEGRLGAEDRARLLQHLEHCAGWREELEGQEAVAAMLAMRPTAEVPLGFTDRVVANLNPAPGWLDTVNWRVWTYRLAPISAMLVLLAALGLVPTEAAAPLEFSDLVADWVVEEDSDALPAISVFWGDEVSEDALLEAVLTVNYREPFR